MTKEELISFEDKIKNIFVTGKIRAPVHLSDGNEDKLIDIFKGIRRTDWVFSAWRSHYHALLHGIDPAWIEDQIIKGFSITLCNPEHKFYTSAIVGGIVPIAIGVAMSIALRSVDDHVWVFVGDMTYRTGACYESIKYAQGHGLPITFVVEDNNIAVQTPTREVWGEHTEHETDETENVIHYEFESSYPHVGAGQWVTF